MRPALARTPALAHLAGAPLAAFPIVDPQTMRRDPAAWNSAGIGADAALAAAQDAEGGGEGRVREDIIAGLSTGTMGARGLFLASGAERARYVGQSIARLLPAHAPLTGARIALVLRADSELYRAVRGGRFAILHLPLGLTGAEMSSRLRAFGPTVLVAPPRELSALAAASEPPPPSLRRIFWGSEPMASLERAWVAERLGLTPGPIYQATEGFIAAACRLGALHLNDDSLELELEPFAPGLFRPIVTDLRRRVQPMVRVRLDDIVQPVEAPCACGFAGRVVRPVAGRVADIWLTPGGALTPDLVDDHMVRALGPGALWRVRGSDAAVGIELGDPGDADRASAAVRELLPQARATVSIMAGPGGPKRRRVTWGATA